MSGRRHRLLPSDHCAANICSAILDHLLHEPEGSSSNMAICTGMEANQTASSTSKCKSEKVHLPDTGVLMVRFQTLKNIVEQIGKSMAICSSQNKQTFWCLTNPLFLRCPMSFQTMSQKTIQNWYGIEFGQP